MEIIIYNNKNFIQTKYNKEEELTKTFSQHYTNIFSEKSYFINKEFQLKTNNFKDSRCDGFVFVWEDPNMPKLYIAEMELVKHSVDKHIIPQLGDFISFIHTNILTEINNVQKLIFEALKEDKKIFTQIQTDTGMEVYELIHKALEDDLQILLVIDQYIPDLKIGLSHIEKAINVKIRKIELVRYKESADSPDELISYSDSESNYENRTTIDDEISDSKSDDIYTLGYHLDRKPEKIVQLFNNFVVLVKDKLHITPKKQYVKLANSKIVLSLVVKNQKIIVYSREPLNEIGGEYQSLTLRDVSNIGHYCNHLPTEITVDETTDFELLKKYMLAGIEKYGGELEGVDNSEVLNGE